MAEWGHEYLWTAMNWCENQATEFWSSESATGWWFQQRIAFRGAPLNHGDSKNIPVVGWWFISPMVVCDIQVQTVIEVQFCRSNPCFYILKVSVGPHVDNHILYMVHDFIPICSMYGICTNIYPKSHPNVGTYTIHGASGIWFSYYFPHSWCDHAASIFFLTTLQKNDGIRPWYHGGLPSLRSILHSTLFAQVTTEGRLGLVVEPFMAARGGNVGNGPEKWPSWHVEILSSFDRWKWGTLYILERWTMWRVAQQGLRRPVGAGWRDAVNQRFLGFSVETDWLVYQRVYPIHNPLNHYQVP